MRSKIILTTLKTTLFVLFLILATIGGKTFAQTSNFVENHPDGSQTLRGHVPADVQSAAKTTHVNLNQMLDLRVVLPLRNQTQLDAFLKDLYDSGSQSYAHFLTPAQFTRAYGPSTDDSNKVKQYLTSRGLVVHDQSPNGLVLDVSGPVVAVEHAFRVNINHYKKSDNSEFFATDTDPTIPFSVAGKITGIAGMDNVITFQAHNHKHPMTVMTAKIGTGPGGFLAPRDIYTAYNLNSITANGGGQTIALLELDGYLQSDIAAFETYYGLANVPLENVLIDGFNGNPTSSGGSAEVTLDIQLLAAFAPGASKILVYEAKNTTQGWIDEWSRIASDNQAKVVSCSWGISESYSSTINFDNAIFMQMAAQGQAVFAASGDCGARDTCSGRKLSVDEPADQPYGTGVGISKVSLNSNGTYSTEAASYYSGGGISRYFLIPLYQKNMISKFSLGSTTMRNVPDIALTADISTAYAFYINGKWGGYWGSSISAPIWAAFLSRVNQGRANAGRPVIGFANPALYQIAKSSDYANDFHDVVTGNNGYYPAVSGYDDATGLGSFNGSQLFNALVSF